MRAYDELHIHLSPLVGAAGVDALLARSAKLTQAQRPLLAELSVLEGGARLRERLQSCPPLPHEAAEALFARFFALLATFIGEGLTERVTRRAWAPSLDRPPPTDKKS